MAAQTTPPSNESAPQGLPPVKPPSGRFILQLFLIPGLIVAGLVFVFVFGGLAWVGSSNPQSFLTNLDNPNLDIRWRAAHELAQVLQRPESLELASNPDFAMDIAMRLKNANDELNKAEKAAKAELAKTMSEIAARPIKQEEKDQLQNEAALAAWRKLRPQRDFVLFLISCCGRFTVPTGVPVLSEIAMMNDGAEIKGMSMRKRHAVLALATLGDNMNRRFLGKNPGSQEQVLTGPQKAAIVDKLIQAGAGSESDDRAAMARYAAGVLQGVLPNGVDKVLAVCSRHEDIFLREEVAQALNFWDGPETEPTLVRLANDDGFGVRIVITEDD
jgi:hypothetical protein